MVPTGNYLRLMRIANLPTAWADVLAGALIAGARFEHAAIIALLCLASSCFYSGGMALNDVCDAERDAASRPDRPIPSGKLTRSRALAFAIVLLGAGWLLSIAGGRMSAWIGAGLVVAIAAYDWLLKTLPIAPAVMGVCRGLNLLLGASAVAATFSAAVWIAAGLLWLYIASLTLFARREAGGASRALLIIGFVGVVAAILSHGLFEVMSSADAREYVGILPAMLVMLLLLAAVIRFCVPAIRSGQPADMQRAVGGMILLIILFDASMVCAVRGVESMLMVCALTLPAIALSRYSTRT